MPTTCFIPGLRKPGRARKAEGTHAPENQNQNDTKKETLDHALS